MQLCVRMNVQYARVYKCMLVECRRWDRASSYKLPIIEELIYRPQLHNSH